MRFSELPIGARFRFTSGRELWTKQSASRAICEEPVAKLFFDPADSVELVADDPRGRHTRFSALPVGTRFQFEGSWWKKNSSTSATLLPTRSDRTFAASQQVEIIP
jgi:hypothetical protein